MEGTTVHDVSDAPDERVVHLRAGGTSLVCALTPDALAVVLHWGSDLGELDDAALVDLSRAAAMPYVDSVVSAPSRVSVLPQHSAGWLGRPGLLGDRSGADWSVAVEVEHSVDVAGSDTWPQGPAGAFRVRSVGVDVVGSLTVGTDIELHPSGVVRLAGWVRNDGEQPYRVAHLEPAIPVPAEARELLDLTGRHAAERVPQRRPFDQGRWVREAWGGRPGHDSPLLMAAGVPGFGFRTGRVWGVHVAWSGNQVLAAEASPTNWRLLSGGELLLPGEMLLGQGETYRSPWLVASWGDGLDELSGRLHTYLRARPQHPKGPRPVLLNVWEAVYFDHDLDRLKDLAQRAARLGVERFVLDDGWFLGRRDDTSSLGDWQVDPAVYPDGLGPLVDEVHGLGMQFGLWVEPEMVSLNSDLARQHPEWVLGTSHGPGVASRQQHVLDLADPQAHATILGQISALIAEHHIDYIKWDHNRPLVDAGRGPHHTPAVHAQTNAVYSMMDELKARHPWLEIESCAGGGGRMDLGIVEHTDRVWVSDCIDAHERHRMVRWTEVLLPPELLGTHVGAGADHTTGRVHALDFRAGTAMWGHLGIEWDLAQATETELGDLAAWITFHKESRQLLHTGRVVRVDDLAVPLHVDGVVSLDGSDALYRVSALDLTHTWPFGRIPLPGLLPDQIYRVTAVPPGDKPAHRLGTAPWTEDGLTLSGRVLSEVGVQAPSLRPDELVILRVRAVGA